MQLLHGCAKFQCVGGEKEGDLIEQGAVNPVWL